MRICRATLLLLLLAAGAPPGLAAQAPPGEPTDAVEHASPLLPPGHWALDALRRADALGLAHAYLPATRTTSRAVAARHLARAAEAAAGTPWQDLAVGWMERFREEFPEAEREPSRAMRLLSGGAEAGLLRETGRAAPGVAEFPPDVTGALPLPDRSGGIVEVEGAAALGGRLAAVAAVRAEQESLALHRWDVRGSLGRWALAVGREAVGYGRGRGGGVVLSGGLPVERVELATMEPLRLPWLLSHLGPVAFHTFLARLPEERHPGGPVLWGASGSLRPHPRLTLSVHRAAMVGGSGIPEQVDAWNLLLALVGKHAEIENQIVSAEASLRLPTEAWLPLTAYCEWGAEDSAGAFYTVPGILCGGLVPALPGLPALALGAEHARFGARRDGNPPWYRHHMFPGNWALEEAPLGHPVGGEGSEWLGYLRATPAAARLELEARAFARERRGENLFVPGREGDSFGVAAEARWRFRADAELEASAARESGDGWAESSLFLSTRFFF